MNPDMSVDELLNPRIHIVCGKGGVGKTTVSAALALVAARHGRKVCVVEVDRRGSLPKLFGAKSPSYEPSELSPGVWGLNVLQEEALAEYLNVQYHMQRISRVLTSSHFVDYITIAAPGLKDILVLGKIWYLEQDRSADGKHYDFDTIIVDAPAAGHMAAFLSAPMGLSDAVQVGPIRRQSDWLVEMLQDTARTVAHVVAMAEEMPVAETVATSAALHDRLHIAQGAAFVNGLYPKIVGASAERAVEDGSEARDGLIRAGALVNLTLDDGDLDALADYARFLSSRRKIQARHLRALRKGIDQPILKLPFLFSSGIALPEIEMLADDIEQQALEL